MPLIDIPANARSNKAPCGECHLADGETCNICGAYQIKTTRGIRDRARELATRDGYTDDYDRAVLLIIEDLEALLRLRG